MQHVTFCAQFAAASDALMRATTAMLAPGAMNQVSAGVFMSSLRLEIINLSDKATIDCSNLIAAHIAVCLIGEGKYAIRDEVGDSGMPLFLFGGHDEFFTKKHGMTFEQAVNSTPREEIAAALNSIELCGKRTSMDNFSGRAKDMARALLEYL